MADGKRYYWLKLYDDFFGSLRIKKLRKMAGGDTFVIIYLKMQLKAMKSEGILQFKGVEEDFVDELALDLDEEPDNVRITLAYLTACGLCETSDNINFFLPYAVDNTGSEGSSAKRMREFRERQASLCDGYVTDSLRLSDGEIDTRDRYKIQEIDREKEGGFVRPVDDEEYRLVKEKLRKVREDFEANHKRPTAESE